MHRKTLYAGIALISAATLLFELVLTRLFALVEWYHFAFLSVSVALLGYASSGTILSLIPRARRSLPTILGIVYPLSIVGCYLLINRVPFDSYQLAWNPRQILYLLIYYVGLVVPFAISGLIVAYWLALEPAQSNTLYAANLVGSALGSLSLLILLPALGGEGTVMVSAALGALGATLILYGASHAPDIPRRAASCLTLCLAGMGLLLGLLRPSWLDAHLSPYKSLSQALRASDARLSFRRWNAYSRVDVVESAQIHSAPGLSLKYKGQLPPQYALTLDGDNLSPISRRNTEEDVAFLSYLPVGLAFRLRPQASALILQPRGGLDVSVALHLGARRVVAVEDNPLVAQVVRDTYGTFVGRLYEDPRVTLLLADGRSALQRGEERFDVIVLSLADSYHPISAGSYSLSENYLYTVEGLTRALHRLSEGGLLVLTRWFQDPPSESLRAGALVVAALERLGVGKPAQHLLAFRSWSTVTLLASPSPLGREDIELFRAYCADMGYDLIYCPGIQPEEANRYNILPQPLDYEAFQQLLDGEDRRALYKAQPYDVSPPTDNHPFFGHHFRWRQIPGIISQLGKTWQPFGGSGFLLVLALLGVALLAAGVLVILPLAWAPQRPQSVPHYGRVLVYFAALGLGYLLVEMPLMQQFILYLGQPSLSFVIVLSALLLSSGVGSLLAGRARLRVALGALIVGIAFYPFALRCLFDLTMHAALAARTGIAILSLLPLGILMGVPFAGGMRQVGENAPGLIPWIWAINGSASVVSSLLATLIALSGGYHLVLALAACCYLAATVALWPLVTRAPKEAQVKDVTTKTQNHQEKLWKAR